MSASPRTLILDCDGTLVSWLPRHYACYRSVTGELGLPRLSAGRYWRMKRGGADAAALLSACGSAAVLPAFRALWLERIESPELLRLDQVLPGVRPRLRGWRASGWRLVLLTSRSRPGRFRRQLAALGLAEGWHRILVAPGGSGGAGKAEVLRRRLPGLGPAIWIGDSEADLIGARLAGCAFCGVTSGVRDAGFLRAAGATMVFPALAEVGLGGSRGADEARGAWMPRAGAGPRRRAGRRRNRKI
jgi:phosphoglycolate phosphatase-like HAD superfamily hydrolase